MKYAVCHAHSHFSILDGLSKPEDIAKRCYELGIESCAITDHGNCSSVVQILKQFEKYNIRPILGAELYVCYQNASQQDNSNRSLLHLPLLALNTDGWKSLIKIISESNRPDFFYHKPRLNLEQIAEYAHNLLAFSGHMGSHIHQAIMEDGKPSPDWQKRGEKVVNILKDIFGEFYLETQLMMQTSQQKMLTDMVRELGRLTKTKVIATPDSHYAFPEQCESQRILLCTALHKTLDEMYKNPQGMEGFFTCNRFYIPSADELLQWGHSEEELNNTLEIADKIDSYSILNTPMLPKFDIPSDFNSSFEYLKHLCRQGWKDKIQGKVNNEDVYKDRIRHELEVIEEAGLSDYYLIVYDIMKFARDNNILCGGGRGSSSGSLISLLLKTVSIDCVKYGLLFERYYNKARAKSGTLPDQDLDFPSNKREIIVEYIRNKYGYDKTSSIVSFQTTKGRGALKGTFRAFDEIPFSEMNRITSNISQESKISDELQKMKEDTGESSIIKYDLLNYPEKFSQWCELKNDTFTGPLAKSFQIACEMESCKSSVSLHPAAVAISTQRLDNTVPMILSKNKELVVGVEFEDAEMCGIVKIDILAIRLLDKIRSIQNILIGKPIES